MNDNLISLSQPIMSCRVRLLAFAFVAVGVLRALCINACCLLRVGGVNQDVPEWVFKEMMGRSRQASGHGWSYFAIVAAICQLVRLAGFGPSFWRLLLGVSWGLSPPNGGMGRQWLARTVCRSFVDQWWIAAAPIGLLIAVWL